MTTHAPLRSQWTKALSVYHVRDLGDGDAPTSLIKDTRLLAVACKRLLGASAATPPHIWKEQGQPERFLLSSWEDRGSS